MNPLKDLFPGPQDCAPKIPPANSSGQAPQIYHGKAVSNPPTSGSSKKIHNMIFDPLLAYFWKTEEAKLNAVSEAKAVEYTEFNLPVPQPLAKVAHAAWVVKLFEEVLMANGWPAILPGPGNGYFECISGMLKEIDSYAENSIKQERIDHRKSNDLFISRAFENAPLENGLQYPVEIFFIAMNMVSRSGANPPVKMCQDPWIVSVNPQNETLQSAAELIGSFKAMSLILRLHEFVEFPRFLLMFDKAWEKFINQMIRERNDFNYLWCGTLHLDLLIKELKCERSLKIYEERQKKIQEIVKGLAAKDEEVQINFSELIDFLYHHIENNIYSYGWIKKGIKKAYSYNDTKAVFLSLLPDKKESLYKIVPKLACLELYGIYLSEPSLPLIFSMQYSLIKHIHRRIQYLNENHSCNCVRLLIRLLLPSDSGPSYTAEEQMALQALRSSGLLEELETLCDQLYKDHNELLTRLIDTALQNCATPEFCKTVEPHINSKLKLLVEKITCVGLTTLDTFWSIGPVKETPIYRTK